MVLEIKQRQAHLPPALPSFTPMQPSEKITQSAVRTLMKRNFISFEEPEDPLRWRVNSVTVMADSSTQSTQYSIEIERCDGTLLIDTG